ncbi:hypothetical protein DB346_02845 [Verrucomicrobia bacterium LW23]|nr:hypothetical protein DB346_03810 [Verrucomicrobia bacterium LW23]PTY04386.1 hypothetical protein DB346_02845 [Verrucomicrobia bacterium LW23]
MLACSLFHLATFALMPTYRCPDRSYDSIVHILAKHGPLTEKGVWQKLRKSSLPGYTLPRWEVAARLTRLEKAGRIVCDWAPSPMRWEVPEHYVITIREGMTVVLDDKD